MYLGEYRIDDYVTLIATTHRFSSGAVYAPTAITYRVYEDATAVEIVADTAMTNFDTETGFYLDRIQCTAVLGYEVGKTYTALIKATVDSVAAITAYTWRVLTPPVNVTQVAGTAQTAGDLKASITTVNDKTSQLNFTAATYVMADVTAISTDTTAADRLETMLDGTGGNTLTATISGDVSGNVTGSIGSLGATAKTDVNTEVDTALADINLDHIAGTATAIPAIVAGTYIDQMMDDGTAVYDRTTDSLQAIRDKETDIETDTAVIGAAGAGLTAVAIGIGGIASTSFAAGAMDLGATAADFPSGIKKNTALANFMFLMVDSTDHLTPKTGLTITATRSIDGAAFGACANAAAEVASGMYKISLAATDLNGDVITLRFTSAAADDRLITIITTTT